MAGTSDHINIFYHQWDLPSKLSPVVVPLLIGIWWLIRRDHSAIKTTSLVIKQAVTGMFMQTVVEEARRLLKLMDDHLPEVLSQASSPKPHRSRFDYFCDSLRAINPEELDRNKYKEIIVEAFSGIIESTISRLIEAAASSSGSRTGELLNPSGLKLELEGVVHLKFAFVSRASGLAILRQRRYNRLHNFAILSYIASASGIFLFWLPGFFDTVWAWYTSICLLVIIAISIPAGLIATYASYRTQQWLENTAKRYQDHSGLANDFFAWTQDQGV